MTTIIWKSVKRPQIFDGVGQFLDELSQYSINIYVQSIQSLLQLLNITLNLWKLLSIMGV